MDRLLVIAPFWMGIMLVAGVISAKVASRLGVPALVLFIAVGMVLGKDVSGLLAVSDPGLAQFVATTALVIILFEGGLKTERDALKASIGPAVSLATVGVALTAVLTGLSAWLLDELSFAHALLLGAVISSTDAAAVFAVVGGLRVPRRVRVTVEAESAMNDPMAIFLTLFMIDWIVEGPPELSSALIRLVWQMGVGILAGFVFGALAYAALTRLRHEASGLYPVFLLGAAFIVFSTTAMMGASGFVAVYVFGFYLSQRDLPYEATIMRFHEASSWMSQISMFVMLGLYVSTQGLLAAAVPGLIIAAMLMFVARPLAVWLTTLGMRFSFAEKLWISWAGLRGAVPIVLATYPLAAGITHSDFIFNVVFFVVLLSATLQGATLPALAERLRLAEGVEPPRTVTLELVAMEDVNIDLIELTLHEGAQAAGKRLGEFRLPDNVTVSAIVRQGRVVTPRGSTRLQPQDHLFILAPRGERHRIETIFAGQQRDEDAPSPGPAG